MSYVLVYTKLSTTHELEINFSTNISPIEPFVARVNDNATLFVEDTIVQIINLNFFSSYKNTILYICVLKCFQTPCKLIEKADLFNSSRCVPDLILLLLGICFTYDVFVSHT